MILVAMSGGVDSSVSAYLVREKFGTCKGATMLLSSNVDATDARAVCEVLGIGHEVIDCREIFTELVINKFIKVYETGGTPNPCIDCNKFLKFGELLKHSERVATGHYARIEHESGRYLLRKAVDMSRDQSYVLYVLTQEQLSRVEFPLGGMLKSSVRELAASLGFTNANKHDSQDICFVPDGNYGAFIERFTGKSYEAGNFVDASGKVLGRHKGIIHYTTGQRKGLGVSARTRLYVSKINPLNNTITLKPESEESRKILVRDFNLIAFDELPVNFSGTVKTRYRQQELPCIVNQVSANEAVIEFKERAKAPAIGQAAVIYDGDYVIGGGTIVLPESSRELR